MAQHVILNHPDVARASDDRHAPEKDWSPRAKLFCILACALASWVIVLAPFFLFG